MLQPVVNLKTRDEAARRRARRNYVRIILNDYVLNPGPSQAPMDRRPDSQAEQRGVGEQDFSRFGLMASFVGAGPSACRRPWPWGPASTSSSLRATDS